MTRIWDETPATAPCPKCGRASDRRVPVLGSVVDEPAVFRLDGREYAVCCCACGYWPTWRKVDGQWQIA